MPIQQSHLITRRQLNVLTGGKRHGKTREKYDNSLRLGTPFNYWGGQRLCGRIHHICIEEPNNHPLPDSTDQNFLIYRTSRRDDYARLPADIQTLQRSLFNRTHPPIPIFWEPTDQTGKSKNAEGGQAVFYVGHWKLQGLQTFQHQPKMYKKIPRCAELWFRFDRFDQRMAKIISICHDKKCEFIASCSFDGISGEVEEETQIETDPAAQEEEEINEAEITSGDKREPEAEDDGGKQQEESEGEQAETSGEQQQQPAPHQPERVPNNGGRSGGVVGFENSTGRQQGSYTQLKQEEQVPAPQQRTQPALPDEVESARRVPVDAPRRKKRRRFVPTREASTIAGDEAVEADSADQQQQQGQVKQEPRSAKRGVLQPQQQEQQEEVPPPEAEIQDPVSVKVEASDDDSVVVVAVARSPPKHCYFRVEFFNQDLRKGIRMIHHGSITFKDLRCAIKKQLTLEGPFASFQFALPGFDLDPKQEKWQVREYIMAGTGHDGSFGNPYQITIKPKQQG